MKKITWTCYYGWSREPSIPILLLLNLGALILSYIRVRGMQEEKSTKLASYIKMRNLGSKKLTRTAWYSLNLQIYKKSQKTHWMPIKLDTCKE